MGRTVSKFMRYYQDGYDLSADVETVGELAWEYDHEARACLSWEVKGGLNGKPAVNIGPVNGVFDTATAGWHSVVTATGSKTVMIPIGEGAVPAAGCPVFGGAFSMASYQVPPGDGMVPFTATFGGGVAGAQAYAQPWGKLIHAKGSETAANTGTGIDYGAGSGGWLMYQVFSITGTGTVTISIDDSTDNSSFGALSGATTAAIATASAPTAGIVELATAASVKRYLRWQIAFGGSATGCEFALAYFRR